jgi:hypothetical protein
MSIPATPRAIVKIDRPGFTDGQSSIVYDSWETKRLIKEVDVELVTDESSQAVVKFFDPKYRLIDTFSDATAKAVVKVYLGYGQELGEPVFKGLLANVERDRRDTTFTAFDMAFVMKLEKRAGYKNKADDLAIIRGLVERNKLKFEGPESPLKLEPHKAMMQDEQTDWAWMMERAHDAGLKIFVRHDTVFAKYPAKVGTPILTLRNGKDFEIIDGWGFMYHTLEDQDGKPKVVKHRRRGKAGKRIEGQSDVGQKGREEMSLKRDMASPTKSKLSRRAQAQKELEREHAFEGHIETLYPVDVDKRPDVRNTVELQAIGKLLSGKYICDAVNYRFAPGELSMGLDLYRDIQV